MKNWLKKVKKTEIEQLFKSGSNKNVFYKLPVNLENKMNEFIRSKKNNSHDDIKQKNHSWKLKLVFALAILVILIYVPIIYILNNGTGLFTRESITDEIVITNTQAITTFTSGEVFVKKESSWEYLEAGDYVNEDETIRVEKDSYCELQFGETGIIRIQENTEISMNSILVNTDNNDVRLKLIFGSVLCNVEKLAGLDKFEVATNTAVFGVRGTQFKVEYLLQEGSSVYVREGKVVVLPPLIDLNKIEEKLGSKGDDVLEIIKMIEQNSPIVEADMGIIVTEETLKETEEIFESLILKIDEIEEQDTVQDITVTELEDIVNEIIQDYSYEIDAPEEIPERVKEELETIEKIHAIELIPLSETPAAETSLDPSDTDEQEITEEIEQASKSPLGKIAIKVEPPDAIIFINNELLGIGNFTGLFKEGEELSFSFEKEGFISESLDIKISITEENIYGIELNAETAEEKEEEQESDEITPLIQTTQQNIEQEQTIEIIAQPETTLPEQTQLEPVEKIFSLSENPIIGNLVYSGGAIVAADEAGKVFAFDTRGNILWSVITNNNPNDISYPVIIGNKVCFSGSKELIIINLNTGSIIQRMELNSSTTHIFGQRIAKYGNYGLFPTDLSVRIMDLNSGEILNEINVPDGTTMTPAAYNDSIYIVNQNGILYIFDTENEDNEPVSLQTNTIQPVAQSLTVYNNRAFFSGRKGNIVCIDLEQNNIIWQKELVSGRSIMVLHDIEFGKSGAFVFAENTIYSLSIYNGNKIFEPFEGVSRPPLYNNGLLYFGREDGNLNIASAETGAILKEYYLSDRITARPVLIENKLFLATEQGDIIIFNP